MAITTAAAKTILNLLNNLIAVIAGNIIKLDISKVPIILIPITMVSAVSIASKVLYTSIFIPVAFAKLSSKVIENI